MFLDGYQLSDTYDELVAEDGGVRAAVRRVAALSNGLDVEELAARQLAAANDDFVALASRLVATLEKFGQLDRDWKSCSAVTRPRSTLPRDERGRQANASRRRAISSITRAPQALARSRARLGASSSAHASRAST